VEWRRGQHSLEICNRHADNKIQRWAELPSRRENYPLYELIDRPTGTAVYRDPFASLRRIVRMCSVYPEVASKIRRMWVHGYYTASTDRLIFKMLTNCTNLRSLSIPWTMVRHLDATKWQAMLTSTSKSLESLELQCVNLTSQQTADRDSDIDFKPFQSVNFGKLRRLKIFGDSNFMPITDTDLYTIASTTTQLEEFYVTCNSSISISGVMTIVRASWTTLRILEHSPRSHNGFRHPHPGLPRYNEHLCGTFRSCPKLESLSISVPSVCAYLFSNDNAKFKGNLQVRALHLCQHENGRPPQETSDALEELLHQARQSISRRAEDTTTCELYIELFFASCVFEPGFQTVHGDFSLAQILSNMQWPQHLRQSGKGPYYGTSLYENDIERPFQCIKEEEYLYGVRGGFYSI
jgi:hypothetical protein